MKFVKCLEKKAMEYAYIWVGNMLAEDLPKDATYFEYCIEALKRYLAEFDFESAIKANAYGFHWYVEIDKEMTDVWETASYEVQLTAFVFAVELANVAESEAISNAGAAW